MKIYVQRGCLKKKRKTYKTGPGEGSQQYHFSSWDYFREAMEGGCNLFQGSKGKLLKSRTSGTGCITIIETRETWVEQGKIRKVMEIKNCLSLVGGISRAPLVFQRKRHHIPPAQGVGHTEEMEKKIPFERKNNPWGRRQKS